MRGTVIIERILQMVLLLALQVLVFNHIHISTYAIPLIAPLFVVWAPLRTNRVLILLSAFALGLVTDVFSGTLGVSAMSLTLIAMLHEPILERFADEEEEDGMKPHWKTMHFFPYFIYLLILFSVHHVCFFLLEDCSFDRMGETILSMLSSLVVSVFFALILDYGRSKRL